VAVFSAVDGVQPQSETVWRQARRHGVPLIAFVNKMDRIGASFERVLEQLQDKLRARPWALGMPLGSEGDFHGWVDLVDGRVPMVVELKGIPGRDEGLVARVGKMLKRYKGKAAIMSFDHWLIRDFPKHAPGIPAGLTAYGKDLKLIEAHFSMLAHELSFTSYAAGDLPNPFVSFVREKLKMPVITWTVHDQPAIDLTFKYADQMTFEGFEPDLVKVA